MKINESIKKYFEQFDIDINKILQEEEVLEETGSEPDLRMILNKISDIQSSNNTHKILFAAGLLELRVQVKKNQEQTSETRRQLERGVKDIQQTIMFSNKKIENLSRKIDSLKDSLDNNLRTKRM